MRLFVILVFPNYRILKYSNCLVVRNSVLLARALLRQPDILVLDEPMQG
jgi:ABC-type Na+ transport system ATPase subunit NatA